MIHVQDPVQYCLGISDNLMILNVSLYAFVSVAKKAVWLTSHLKVDYAKLAERAGFKTAASANTSFATLKKKLLAGAIPETTSKPNTKKTKDAVEIESDNNDVSPKKVQDENVTEPDTNAEPGTVADDEGSQPASPAKKAPRKKAAAKNGAPKCDIKVEENGEGEGDGGDANASTPAPTPAKRVYKRKPKDPNALPAKRGKKTAQAEETVVEPAINASAAAEQPAETEYQSMFGNGDVVKVEEEDSSEAAANQTDAQLQDSVEAV